VDNTVPVAGGVDLCGGDAPSNSDVGPSGGGVPPSNLARRDADSTVPVAGGRIRAGATRSPSFLRRGGVREESLEPGGALSSSSSGGGQPNPGGPTSCGGGGPWMGLAGPWMGLLGLSMNFVFFLFF